MFDLGGTSFAKAGQSGTVPGCSCWTRGALLVGAAVAVWLIVRGAR